ncbi:DUF6279 family lipoprotein [Caenimonas terrae]|uniref:DUF6279 family lipoprotein n=1 Tax=Caenimonas terrae TaxID=696074 RepID=A0ABW0NJ45_9BURK
MLDQRTAGQSMQHFGQAALHARALAGGHDDHIQSCHRESSLFMHRFAHLVRIIGLLSVAVALAGCSAIKLGYNTLPQVAGWWLDGYIDFSDEQERRMREDVARLHLWHRREELPKISALLRQVEQMVGSEMSADEICALVPPIRLRIAALLERAEPAAATLALGLRPEQLQHLQRKYEKNNADYRKDWVDLSLEDLREKQFKQYLDRMETFYGRLDDQQREIIRAQVERSLYSAQTNLRERQRRQQDILRTLRRLGGQPVSLPDARAAIHQAVEHGLQSPDPKYRSYEAGLIQQGCANLAALHQSTTPQQRQSAVRRLRAYQRDLDELAGEP